MVCVRTLGTQRRPNLVNDCKVCLPRRLVEIIPIVRGHKRWRRHIVCFVCFVFITYHFGRTRAQCQVGSDHNGFRNPIQRLLVMCHGRLAQNIRIFFKRCACQDIVAGKLFESIAVGRK